MSAPMSVKERIAMMKQKEEEEKAKARTPEPPVRRSSISDRLAIAKANGTPESVVTSRLSAAEEIAMLRRATDAAEDRPSTVSSKPDWNKTQQNGSAPSMPPPPAISNIPSHVSLASIPPPPPPLSSATANIPANLISPSTPPPPPPPSRRSSLPVVSPLLDGTVPASGSSIAERMESLKNNQKTNTAASTPPPPPPPVGAARRSSLPFGLINGDSHGLSVAERMASLKAASTDKPAPPPSPPAAPNSTHSSSNRIGPTVSVSVPPPPPPRPAQPLTPYSQPPISAETTPTLPSVASHHAPFTPTTAAAAPSSSADSSSEGRTPPTRMSIAERMAALSNASSNSSSNNTSAQSTPGSATTATRRLSVGLAGLGAKINLSALSPNAVRPPITPKRDVASSEPEETEGNSSKSSQAGKVSFSASSDDGEFRHLNLTRPAVPSMRRKQATASVRLQANAWDTADLGDLGGRCTTTLSTVTPSPRPNSLSIAATEFTATGGALVECTETNTTATTSTDADTADADDTTDIPVEANGGTVVRGEETGPGPESEKEERAVRTSTAIDRSNRASLL